MKNLLHRLLHRSGPPTASDAKARLKVLLVHDEIDLPPARLRQMRAEILEVVRRYVDVEDDGATFELHKEQGGVALVGNVPVRRVHARA